MIEAYKYRCANLRCGRGYEWAVDLFLYLVKFNDFAFLFPLFWSEGLLVIQSADATCVNVCWVTHFYFCEIGGILVFVSVLLIDKHFFLFVFLKKRTSSC